MHPNIEHQKRMVAAQRQWWSELKKLADAKDVPGFYEHYAKYLEASGIYSGTRLILHNMAILVSEQFPTEGEVDDNISAV